jgi:hypothetical protein
LRSFSSLEFIHWLWFSLSSILHFMRLICSSISLVVVFSFWVRVDYSERAIGLKLEAYGLGIEGGRA